MALGVVVEGSRSGRYLRTNSVNAGGLEAALIPASGQATHDTSVSSDTSASVMDFSQNIRDCLCGVVIASAIVVFDISGSNPGSDLKFV